MFFCLFLFCVTAILWVRKKFVLNKREWKRNMHVKNYSRILQTITKSRSKHIIVGKQWINCVVGRLIQKVIM